MNETIEGTLFDLVDFYAELSRQARLNELLAAEGDEVAENLNDIVLGKLELVGTLLKLLVRRINTNVDRPVRLCKESRQTEHMICGKMCCFSHKVLIPYVEDATRIIMHRLRR